MLENINDERTKDIYKKLGPFDHFEYSSVGEETEQKNLRLDFDKRKSGTLFRG